MQLEVVANRNDFIWRPRRLDETQGIPPSILGRFSEPKPSAAPPFVRADPQDPGIRRVAKSPGMGLEAYTVELRVRFRAAVATGVPATIRGTWLRAEGPLHLLHASLEQGGKVCAHARAKFFEGSPNQPSQAVPGGAGMRQLLGQARKRLSRPKQQP